MRLTQRGFGSGESDYEGGEDAGMVAHNYLSISRMFRVQGVISKKVVEFIVITLKSKTRRGECFE